MVLFFDVMNRLKITFEVELAQSMIRQVVMYFSMVRRRACWASLVKWSTSVITTTLNSLSLVVVVICLLHIMVLPGNSKRILASLDFWGKHMIRNRDYQLEGMPSRIFVEFSFSFHQDQMLGIHVCCYFPQHLHGICAEVP